MDVRKFTGKQLLNTRAHYQSKIDGPENDGRTTMEGSMDLDYWFDIVEKIDKRISEVTVNHVIEYTENGEITFNTVSKVYTVWDESYTDTVCTTNYPKVAEAALDAYAREYLP